MTENVTENEVEETYEANEEGVAYSSESAPNLATAARPATIAPGAATGRRKEAGARVRIVPGTMRTRATASLRRPVAPAGAIVAARRGASADGALSEL